MVQDRWIPGYDLEVDPSDPLMRETQFSRKTAVADDFRISDSTFERREFSVPEKRKLIKGASLGVGDGDNTKSSVRNLQV